MTEEGSGVATRRFVLEAVVFTAAGVGMVLELAGSRLMSPYFGNSLFVWTSLIGVILAFMSLGNYLGGRLADRWLDPTMLSWVLGWAALGTVVTSYSGDYLLPALGAQGGSKAMSVVAACLLFAAPSILLGIVSPYSIRVRMHGMEHAGATVGAIYALGTVGSIAGTFAAGFWLISVVGVHDLILLCVAVLGGLSALVMGRLDWRKVALLALVAVLAIFSYVSFNADGDEIVLDTQYDRYMIRSVVDPQSGRPLIGLSRDFVSAESVSYADSGDPYPFQYYSYYDAGSAVVGGARKALLVGGGTFSYPRIFLSANPGATMDVVEIDGQLVDVAAEYFGYKPDPRMNVFLEDGRTFINRAAGPYDAVFMDAFKSEATVPYQLTTVESWQRCADLLDDDGVLVMNVIASPQDERAQFFNALTASLAKVFPQVEVYAVQGEDGGRFRNTSIIASKSPGTDLAARVAQAAPELATHHMSDYRVPDDARPLTDDFAPVDQLIMGL